MKKKKKVKRFPMYPIGGLIGDDDPRIKPRVYNTQAQLDADNLKAQQFMAARMNKTRAISSNAYHVGRKVGDPVVPYIDAATGKELAPASTIPAPKKFSVPSNINLDDLKDTGSGGLFYTDPQTGYVVDNVDSDVLGLSRFKRPVTTPTTSAPIAKTTFGIGGMVGGPVGMGIDVASKGIMELINTLSNDPRAVSDEPIVNTSTTKNMFSPYKYAMGGDIDQYSDEELAELQAQADQYGISIEELLAQLEGQEGGEEEFQEEIPQEGMEEEEQFATGGWIKKASASIKRRGTKGKCTPMSKPGCTGRARALAKTFKKIARNRKHAYGGRAKASINVEGGEVLQAPSGITKQVHGAKHEQGGVDVSVPKGTKIYSDRLKIDGKSMQERKLARERKLAKLTRLTERNPQDRLLKSTFGRTSENLALEENKDMAIQEIAKELYDAPTFAYGGRAKRSYAGGGKAGDPEGYYDEFGMYHPSDMMSTYGNYTPKRTPGALLDYQAPDLSGGSIDPGLGAGRNPIDIPARTGTVSTTPIGTGIGAGDILGLAGNAFNAIAPILNTKANRRATKPNINRFRGFGRRALQANTQAQDYVAGVKTNAMTDINTSANSSYARNRNSASGVNTLRALDATTDMARNKARNATNDSFSKEMINLLSQRAGLENQKDMREMSGETARDLEDKGDTDNYYSNMAQNLVNFGTNVQGMGRNLNTAKSNKINSRLISQLSKYNLALDDEGNLITGR